MIDDILATFLHRFTTDARRRLAAATAAVEQRDPTALATAIRDFHSLAGEAGLLGIAEVVPLARRAEDLAKELVRAPAEPTTDLLAVLAELSQVVERRAAR